MGILAKLGFIFIILVIGAILLYFYDRPLFLSMLSSIYSAVGKQTTTYNHTTTSNLTTTVAPYYENATVKQDLAGIEKVIPANEIKAVRTFVNPSTNFTTQLESYNDFIFTDSNNTFVYYNGTYAPSGLFATGDIYNNRTFTNYMPWLQGKIVYVQFPVGSVGWNKTTNSWNPPRRYVNLPYLVTKVYKENDKFYYNFTQAFSPTNPVLVNTENQTSLAQWYNRTNGALGFFYNGTEYIVGR